MVEFGEKLVHYKKYNVSDAFYYYRRELARNSKSPEYLEKIMGTTYQQNKSMKENIKKLIDILFNDVQKNDLTIQLTKNIYKVVETLKESKDYSWFNKKILDYMSSYKGIVYEHAIQNNVTGEKHIIKQYKVDAGGYYKKYMKYKTKHLTKESKVLVF